MPTVKDVARYAGVSVTTVSRVLNQYPHVVPDVRERVRQACDALGYRANGLARSMRRGFTRSLGLIVRDMGSANFGAICAASESAAGERGYQLFVCNTNRDTNRERRYIAALLERRVDGLVLFAADDRVNNLDLLGDMGPPVVLVESELGGFGQDQITSDGDNAAAAATQYLLSLGHRRIAFLAWGQEVAVGRGRLNGYRRALAMAGITPDVALVRFCGVNHEQAAAETAFALSIQPPPTALLISAGDLTPGALEAVLALGLKVPQQLSVLAFDDREATRFFNPPISLMARKVPELGTRAVELLLDRLEGRIPEAPQSVTVPFSLVVRGSTGPAPR